MTVKQRIGLVKLGVDIEKVLDTFCGDEDTYISCLRKFLKDENYDKMISSIETKDVKRAFEAAHSLKGVSGNLGFGNLYKEVSVITEVFRESSFAYNENNLMNIKAYYNEIIETIESL